MVPLSFGQVICSLPISGQTWPLHHSMGTWDGPQGPTGATTSGATEGGALTSDHSVEAEVPASSSEVVCPECALELRLLQGPLRGA